MAPRLYFGMISGGDVALKESFLVLFGIARAKDASVVAHLDFYGDSNPVECELC
jgi:hypothetical protein